MSPRARTGAIAGAVLALFVLAVGVFVLPFAYPTPPPIVTRFTATQSFSPNQDTRRDLARVSVRLHDPSRVTLDVRVPGGRVVRHLVRDAPHRRGWVRVSWGGRNDAGRPVPDGEYAVVLRARSGKKRWNASRVIRVDTTAPRPATLRVESALAAPGAGECRVEVVSESDGTVLLEALGLGTTPLRRVGPRPVRGGQALRWTWDGRGPGGNPVAPGLYRLRATLADTPGNRVVGQRTCWVGHLTGSPVPARPGPGDRVRVRLRGPDGRPLAAGTPVRLALHRRTGTPGANDRAPLGRRVGAQARGPASRVVVRLPRRLRPDALWLVATTRDGRALIPLPPAGP